jgi:hypothetical protein
MNMLFNFICTALKQGQAKAAEATALSCIEISSFSRRSPLHNHAATQSKKKNIHPSANMNLPSILSEEVLVLSPSAAIHFAQPGAGNITSGFHHGISYCGCDHPLLAASIAIIYTCTSKPFITTTLYRYIPITCCPNRKV